MGPENLGLVRATKTAVEQDSWLISAKTVDTNGIPEAKNG